MRKRVLQSTIRGRAKEGQGAIKEGEPNTSATQGSSGRDGGKKVGRKDGFQCRGSVWPFHCRLYRFPNCEFSDSESCCLPTMRRGEPRRAKKCLPRKDTTTHRERRPFMQQRTTNDVRPSMQTPLKRFDPYERRFRHQSEQTRPQAISSFPKRRLL